MKRQFLKRIARLATAGIASVAAPWSWAQSGYPDRPIKLIVPFPPGGSVDPIARVVGLKLGELLGKPIVIDNRVGGNTAIGAGLVAKAAPDGYTLLFTAGSTHVIHTMQSKLPYDSIKDFVPVCMVSKFGFGYMLAVHPSVPANTLPEFVAYARANPGKLNYASSGIGNANHLAGELFNILAGSKIVHVPYKGGALALQDMLAGRIQMMITNTPALQSHVDAGTLRALAYTVPQPSMPGSPLFAQYGMAEFESIESINVLLAPLGTPEPVITRLSTAMQRVLAMPEVRAGLEGQKQFAAYQGPAELGTRMRADRAKYAEVIDKAQIQLTP